MMYHMRRQDKEVKDQELIKKILRETKYVTIAMSKDNQPYLASLSHGYDEENNCIYIHCADEGKKLDYLKANNVVWGQAFQDHGYHVDNCSHLYATVQFQGRVAFIEDMEGKRHAIRTMINQLEPNPEKHLDRLLHSEGLPTTTIAKISLDRLSGKKSAEVTL
jgi:nitroimidazol reductase NimA-like FMN-containing flavoprotein (pyridoxamine 5'-phosphate oxidase superfamily)